MPEKFNQPKIEQEEDFNQGLDYSKENEAGFDGLVSGENPDLLTNNTNDQEKMKDAEDIDIEKLMERSSVPPPLSEKYRQILEKILEQIPREDEVIYRGTVIGTEEVCYLREVLEEYHDVLDRPEDIPFKKKKVYSDYEKKEIYVNVDNRKELYRKEAVEGWKELRSTLSQGDYPGPESPEADSGYISEKIEPYFRTDSAHFYAFFDLIIQRPDGVFAVPTGAINAEIILKAMMEGLKFETEKQGWEGVKVPYFTYPHSIALTRGGGGGPRLTLKELIAITEPSILHIYNQREDSNKVKIDVFDDCSQTGGSRRRVEELIRQTYAKLQDEGQIPRSCELELDHISEVYPDISEAYRFEKFDEDSNDRRPVSISDGMPEFRREQLAFKLADIFGFFTGRLYGNIITPMEKPKNKIRTRNCELSHEGLLQGIKGTLERKH